MRMRLPTCLSVELKAIFPPNLAIVAEYTASIAGTMRSRARPRAFLAPLETEPRTNVGNARSRKHITANLGSCVFLSKPGTMRRPKCLA
jgi:hypothetical protein